MTTFGNAVAVAAALALGIVAYRSERTAPLRAPPTTAATAAHELVVPHAVGVVELDGELGDAIWQGAVARTGAFVDANGKPARPYSDARFVTVNGQLIVALYAADEDIRTIGRLRDALRVTVGGTTFEVSATGELRGAPPGTRIGHDHDGTVDDAADDDEEWVIELSIPLAELGLQDRAGDRTAFAAERCDTTRAGVHSCSSVRETLVLAGSN